MQQRRSQGLRSTVCEVVCHTIRLFIVHVRSEEEEEGNGAQSALCLGWYRPSVGAWCPRVRDLEGWMEEV